MYSTRGLSRGLFIGVIVLLIGANGYPANGLNNVTEQPASDLTRNILISTVHIRINSDDHAYSSFGLGTLFKLGGEKYLLTHNHWSSLSPSSEVIFSNWENIFVMKISGQQFLDLVRYRDAGSMVLQAPLNLHLRALPLKMDRTATEREHVMVVKTSLDVPGQIEISEAKILASRDGDAPGYILTILDGTEIREGDSGGGIWQGDQLLGNLWYVILEHPSVDDWNDLDVACAAQFPAEIEGLTTGLQPVHVPEGE